MTVDSVVRESVAVADPDDPGNFIKPNADGSINIQGSISATSAATATAAAPAYSEGISEPLSQNLTGDLRVIAKQSGTWTVGISAAQTIAVTNAGTFAVQASQATAANLNATVVGTGTFLVQAAQSSTWTVGLSAAQTLATVTTVGTVTNLVQFNGTTIATNSGNKDAGTLRTLIATDALAVPTWGHGALAATAPAGATYQGARAATANPTAVTDGQLVGSMGDKVGRQVVVPYAARDLVGQASITLTSTTAETTLISAVSSTFLDLLSINLTNSGVTATRVDIRDDTAGTVRAVFYVPAGDMRGQTYTIPFTQTATNKNWTAQCSASTGSLYVTVQYVKNI